MNTTLNKIRAHSPCAGGYKTLLQHLGKTQADDEPLSAATVLDSNGLDDALWCLRSVTGHDREIRLYAVWCARQVQHLMTDPRSIAALDVAERFADGQATANELENACQGSQAAAKAAAAKAAAATMGAAWAAAGTARAAAAEAAWAAARAAAEAAAWTETETEAGAREDMRAKQADKLRELCAEVAV